MGAKLDDTSLRKPRSIDWSLGAMTALNDGTVCGNAGREREGREESRRDGTGRIKSSRAANSPPKVDERTAMATCLPMKLHDEAMKSMQDMQDLWACRLAYDA